MKKMNIMTMTFQAMEINFTDKDGCVLCGECGRDGKLWYRSIWCSLWAHPKCSGSGSRMGYTCDLC
jgi:hypothetical protein